MASEKLHNIIQYDGENNGSQIVTPMQQFYAGKSIFITGGTGFLGKVIMEKLLRTCDPDVIYILIRSKKGKDGESRIKEIIDDPLFEVLRKEKPKFHHKIVGVNGDCVLPGLGIDSQERAMLQKNVNIVFHVAATVRFDEKLKLALGINVCGTKEIMLLCREMNNLSALIHVSTAYANCNQSTINERFYTPSLTGDNAIKLTQCLDESLLDRITPDLIKEFPNTYTFTKCLAENLVQQYAGNLPVVVFRPAIVIPTYREPVPGWIDNMYGPTGIIVGVGAGLLRVIQVIKENRAEIVPVDYCVNSLLASAWDVSKNKYSEPPVYNYVTTNANPITWEQYTTYGIKHGATLPLSKSIWFYTFTMSSSYLKVAILKFFYHILPGLIMDFGLLITGKKPRMLQIYKKIHRFCGVLSYFNNGKWVFTCDNVKNLWTKLDADDQKLFYFNMDEIEWDGFTKDSMYGIRTYLMKDDPKTIPDSIKRMKRMKMIHYTLLYLIYAVGLYFILSFLYNTVFQLNN